MPLIRHRLFAAVSVPLCAALLAGCAGNAPVKVTGHGSASALTVGYRVPNERGPGHYALLEPAGEHWRVLRLAGDLPARSDDKQEILFISRDRQWVQPAYDYAMKHAYFNCMAFAKGQQSDAQGVAAYSPCGASRFAKVDVVGTAGLNAFAVPLTLGLGVGTNRVVDTAAVQAALASTGLLGQLERAQAARQRADRALAQLARAAADLGSQASASLVFEERVVDESGFFNRTDEKFGRLVRLRQPDPAEPYRTELLRLAKASYADADQFAKAYEAVEQRINALAEALQDAYALDLQCGAQRLGPFSVQLECPSSVPWSAISRGQKVTLLVKVLNAAPRTLAPSLVYGDESLQVRVDDREVQLENRTSVYVEVREVSCYVAGEISTRRWTVAGEYLTLPPRSQLKPALAQSELCRDAAERKLQLPPLRMADVKGRSLRFGIAVKYRRAGEAVDRTLFQDRNLSLEALVAGAL